MSNAESNGAANDATITTAAAPAIPEPSVDEQIAQAEEKLAQAEQHLTDARDAKSHWTKVLNKLRK